MIVVTGGAGFIGSNLIHALNQSGHDDILAVDDLSDGKKFQNLNGLRIADYLDKSAFLSALIKNKTFMRDISFIFHQGACSTTTEWDGRYMMENNYEYSKQVLHYCVSRKIPLIYASSAAVYGASRHFAVDPKNEHPLNVYGYSKLLFDQYVRRVMREASSPIVGLRYFNVYGPREQHKGSMASVAFHFDQQIRETGAVKLFAGTEGYANGEQQRDFVYVDDVVNVNLWFADHTTHRGIFNVGTGRAQTFNDVAKAVIKANGRGEITYIPFPDHLKGCYQHHTQADIAPLRALGYEREFSDVATGVGRYFKK